MNLRDKAAKVNFDGLDDVPSQTAALPAAATASAVTADSQPAGLRPKTTGVAGISERISLHHQVQELQAQVTVFETAQFVTKLEPRRIRQSKWKNRHELSYATQEYAQLKAEIEAAGGNVQPIKVRRVGKGADGQDDYEVVYGRRRLRACLELKFEVSAIVEDMDDVGLFKEMERENRYRADLSPWEQGVMYKDALDAKLFASQRQMAAALNVSLGALNVALALASLPEEVINAFPTPLELQYRWAADLNKALEKDTARVMMLARDLASSEPKVASKKVLDALVSVGGAPKPGLVNKDLMAGDQVVGSLSKDSKGTLKLKIKGGVLTATSEKKLAEFIERLLS